MFSIFKKINFLKKKHSKDFANKIVVGLGNYGSEYFHTRHNIGYMVATALIEKYNGKIEKKSGIANYSIIGIAGQKILVVLPLTYMNRSGIAAKRFLEEYSLLSKDLLIVVDEYNFPLGKIHLKSGGGGGGHNGISSIITEIDSREFFRLRCGISRNFTENELVDYVLSAFNANEIDTVNTMIANSIKAIEFFIEADNAGKAMSMINSEVIFRRFGS